MKTKISLLLIVVLLCLMLTSLSCSRMSVHWSPDKKAGFGPPPHAKAHGYRNKLSAEVEVEAIPDTYYKYSSWTGDVPVGYENNSIITFVMDSDKSLMAHFKRIIYPPVNFAGQKVSNRSLAQVEYINALTWQANSINTDIVKYKIYLMEQNNRIFITELNSSTFLYWHRKVEKIREYKYQLVAVNNQGQEGDPAYITVR